MKKIILKEKKDSDPFRWMERASKKRSAWLSVLQKETNKYLKGERNRSYLHKRYTQLFRIDSMELPVERKGIFFLYYRQALEEDYSIYMKKNLSGNKIKLVDSSKIKKKFNKKITNWSVSKNGRYIVLSLSEAGNDKWELRVFDVNKRKFTNDHIKDINYPYFSCWDSDSFGFWYTRSTYGRRKGLEKYYKRLYYHKLGEPEDKDQLYFGAELAKEDWPVIERSPFGEFLIVTVHHLDTNTDVFIEDSSHNFKLKRITKGMKARSYGYIHNGYIYLYTSYKAPNMKILRAKILNGKLGNWQTFLPESKNKIESCVIVSDHMIIEYLDNVTSRLHSIDLLNRQIKIIDIPPLAIVDAMSQDIDSGEIFVKLSSLTLPSTIYKLNISNLRLSKIWKAEIPFKKNDFMVKQKWFRSSDGTRIPAFLVHKKGLKLDGNNPMVVYAYGGFGSSVLPHFTKSIIPFIENGGIYALVNIRGGGEFGEKWHKSIIKRNKQKGFDDFACALKYFIDQKYTQPEKLVIWGASNGGLLMSVMLVQYPKLFKAAVIAVPVTDMLRFHLFNGGRWWMSEYGDPDNKKISAYLFKYSPYHNVKEYNYPSTLFLTSEKDDRVHPMHTFKMVARLKNNSFQKNSILLRVEKNSGHSGADLIFSIIDELSDTFTFIFKELKMNASE